MSKEPIRLSIEEDVLQKAKKQIPNISGFLEECLKQYLGIGGNLIPTYKTQELNETIARCQLQLYMMNERSNIEKAREEAELFEINLAWRRIYTNYRDTKHIPSEYMEDAVKILGVPEDKLREIAEIVYIYGRDYDVDFSEWSDVYAKFGEGYEGM